MIQLIKGFKDILPEDMKTWRNIEEKAISLFDRFGYKEIRLPIMEKSELFKRSIGEHTDIVEKEMYTFPDRKGDLLTLRPEATASLVRSYIQHKMYATEPVRKFYTIGPMFRRERPQKGRYRQFYQIDAEIFGMESAYADVELIHILVTLFSELNLTELVVHLNSLGCPHCRPAYKEKLITYLTDVKENLCEDCTRRLDKNPLRVLDCKVPKCQESLQGFPVIIDSLCEACNNHFMILKKSLDHLHIEYEIDNRLVRGLDYYTRTIFEIQTSALGAQSAVVGGGRYDGLIKLLGGPDIPATGFAIGFDRLAEIVSELNAPKEESIDVFIAPLGEESDFLAFNLSLELCYKGIQTEADTSGKSLKSLMKRANKLNAAYTLMIGEEELKNNLVILRNMETKEQMEFPIVKDLADMIIKEIRQS